MADKKPPKDEITEQRWLREHFKTLGEERPQLKTTQRQARLTAHLTHHHTEEQETCPDNPLADPEADQQEPDTSTPHGA